MGPSMVKAKPRSKKSQSSTPSKSPGKSPGKSLGKPPSKSSAHKSAESQKRGGAPFRDKGRSYGAIFIILILVLSGLVVVLGALPGMDDDDKAEYGVRAFFYNANHTAEKGGHTEYAMYLANTGNRKDTLELRTVNNAGNFEVWFGIFSVDSGDNVAHLAEGAASQGLIDLFEGHGQELSSEATVTRVDDEHWEIEDDFVHYQVNKALTLLNFFQQGQASIPLKDGKSTVIVVTADASSRASGLNYAEVQVRSGKDAKAKTTIRFNVEVVDDLGEAITKDDSVGMWYTGMLTDGTLFDGNVDAVYQIEDVPHQKDIASRFNGNFEGELFDLKPSVGGANVIEGWQKGVPGLMNGETKVIRIPPGLAYGYKDHKLAGEELIFEITLGAVY